MSDGGVVWCQLRLAHDTSIDTLIADTKDDFRDASANLSIQVIQHWDVAQLGFLKNLHPEVNIPSLTEFFNEELRKVCKDSSIRIGLKVKMPYDGRKKAPED